MKKEKLLYLLWGGVPLTKAVYLFIGINDRGEFSAPLEMIHYLFLGTGCLLCLAGIALSRRLYSNRKPQESPFFRIFLVPGSGQQNSTWASFFSAFVISLGLAETPALFDLVGFLIAGNIYYFSAMIAVSLIAWAFNFPRPEKYRGMMEEK
ncbi:hypothetical protein K7I13_10545 [Brucepastera parasyntrophica]|uniref:hypothetical protein n=1 Tax=Brucepastera parasyntrophica TaxID=2880008 RepID=UPI00210E024F|nr:hypothetical protein [Brucepastera parasyntrophica]ULQ58956.1 hypothetical protein K7I13_10545 [Brucepastera parasyntrophica]